MRFSFAAVVVLAACKSDGGALPDAGPPDDAGVTGDDAPAPDAGIDVTPPVLIAIAPDGSADLWLHEPIMLVFDEPVVLADARVDATLAGSAIAATLAPSGDRIAVVTLDPAARGLGMIDVRVDGIRDRAGNAIAQPIEVARTVTAWNRPVLGNGNSSGSPALAVSDAGGVYAAWVAGGAIVSNVGAPLGSGSSPAIALGESGAPIVAWIAGGDAHAARWDGTSWIALPSPGAGDHVALAARPGGGAVTALVTGGGYASVQTLAGTSWVSLGILATGAIDGEPAIAVAAANRVAVGWISAANVRVYRYAGAWTALGTIPLGTPPMGIDHLSLAARDTTIAVAWDQWGGSFGVFAAVVKGAATAWTRLGRLLDVDAASDAVAPAIAIDASGAAIVAWTETIETNQRGIIARWSGAAWAILGGPTWLAGTVAPTRPTLALHAGGAPVIGFSAAGTLGIARFNGPSAAAFGIATRPSIAGCAFDPAAPPARLLATGCFTLAGAGKPAPHAGLVPYDIVVELWSDGAKKRRWIALPDGASMSASSTGAWAAPPGAFIVKEFALETTPGNPATRRAIETRVLARDANGWSGFSYQWRADGSDADLLNDGTFTVDWPLDGGGTHTHLYPSRSQCLSCHESSYGPLLGLRPQQLARWFDYDGTIADQIPTLAHIGVGPSATATPFIAAHDPSATPEQRMRSYMAANCAHCHNPQHISIKDLRYTTPLAQTNLCASITPGDPAGSVVYQKVTSRPGMPALGTLYVDPLAGQLLGAWISGMTSCP